MKSQDKLEVFSVRAARRLVAKDKTIKASVMFGPDIPLGESASTRVRLFERVGDADKFFRMKLAAKQEAGYVKKWGALKYGAFDLEREPGEHWYIALDKR